MTHPDDEAVDRFAAAMKLKLAQKRAEGRGGWERADCTATALSSLLRGHVEKGDPLDVGNFAMMLHQRGDQIAPASSVAEATVIQTLSDLVDDWGMRAGDADALLPASDQPPSIGRALALLAVLKAEA